MSAAQSNCTQPSAHPFRKPASSALSADSRFMFQPVGSRPPIKRPIGPNSSVVRPDNPSLSTLRPIAPKRNFSSPPLSSAQRRMTPVGPGHSGGYGPVTRPTWPPANGYPGRNGPLGSAGPQHNPNRSDFTAPKTHAAADDTANRVRRRGATARHSISSGP